MGTIETLIKVSADAKQAVSGLKPLQTSLAQTATDAKVTEKALNDLGTGTHKIGLNDSAITNAKTEVSRLRAQMRDALALDINADTKDAQKQISQLQRTIKVLEQEDVSIPATVEVDTSQLSALQTTTAAIRSGLSSGIGSGIGSSLGPLAGQLFKVGAAGAEAGAGGEAAAGGIAATATASAAAVPVVGGVVAALVALSAIAIKFGTAAATVQTSVVQLQALTGDKQVGKDLFADLQKWAATTPFAIDDATDATKRLLAAGVQVKDINDQLSDMGNLASATGVPLSQIATTFGQMEAKGRLTTEDIQQLTDAGIPAWKTLADAMGVTVEQVQDMATAGQLGADKIDLLRESLAKKFPTAMADQAATFNGQMSTFHDTLDQTEQNIGTIFLPLMTDVLSMFNSLVNPVLTVTQSLASWQDRLEKKTGLGVLSLAPNAIGAISIGLDLINGGLDDSDEKANKAADSTKAFNAAIDDVARRSTSTGLDRLATKIDAVAAAEADAAEAADQHEISMKNLQGRVESTSAAFDDLMSTFTATNDAMIAARTGVYDYQGALDDLAESLGKSNTFSPDSEEGRKNWDNLVSLAQAGSTRVENALANRGAGAADKIFNQQRNALHSMLTDAGVGSGRAWDLVNQVFKKPLNMKIKLDAADVKRIDADLERLRKKKRKIQEEFDTQTASPISPDRAERLGQAKDLKLEPIQQQINIDLKGKKDANDELDGLSKDDRGNPRKAQVNVTVPQREIDEANRQLDGIIKLRRTAEIQVNIIPPDIPLLGSVPLGGPRGTGQPRLNANPSADTATPTPRRSPVNVTVNVDGKEVASHVQVHQRSRRRVA